jgi:hypothetical protein
MAQVPPSGRGGGGGAVVATGEPGVGGGGRAIGAAKPELEEGDPSLRRPLPSRKWIRRSVAGGGGLLPGRREETKKPGGRDE